MSISMVDIVDVLVFSLSDFPDYRGMNSFPFQGKLLQQALGHQMNIDQVNVTHTLPGTFRGIHYALVPPGQAKYIFVNAGSCIDYLVDLRRDSPTFLSVVKIPLIAPKIDISCADTLAESTAIYIPEGIGHGIYAPEESATITYLCSRGYNPQVERSISPLDPALKLGLDPDGIILSLKDRQAPLLAESVLPDYHTCQQWSRQQRQTS